MTILRTSSVVMSPLASGPYFVWFEGIWADVLGNFARNSGDGQFCALGNTDIYRVREMRVVVRDWRGANGRRLLIPKCKDLVLTLVLHYA